MPSLPLATRQRRRLTATPSDSSLLAEKNQSDQQLSAAAAVGRGLRHSFLRIFERSNGGSSGIDCQHFLALLDGLRVLSMSLIYCGHVVVMRSGHSEAGQLKGLVEKWLRYGLLGHAAFGGMFCVDSFFFIGGFLTAYRLAVTLRSKGWGSAVQATVSRVVRVMPSMVAVVVVVAALETIGRLSSGIPFISKEQAELLQAGPTGYGSVGCVGHWWQVTFLMGSVANPRADCAVWLWYLSNDIQFFLLGCILLVLGLGKHWYFMAAVAAAATAVSIALTANLPFSPVVVWMLDIPAGPTGRPAFDLMDSSLAEWLRVYYIKPWHRFPCYAVGLLYGLRAHKKPQPGMPLKMYCAAAAALIFIPALVSEQNVWVGILWATLGKPLWGVVLGEALLSCRAILDAKKPLPFPVALLAGTWLRPLARLSFGFYLWHPIALWLLIVCRVHRLTARDFLARNEWALAFLLPALAGLVLAALNFVFIEVPAAALLRERRIPGKMPGKSLAGKFNN